MKAKSHHMVIFRCTKKVSRGSLKLETSDVPSSTTVLGDWYINRLNIGSGRWLLCVSEKSLLAIIVPAKDLPDFPERLRRGLTEMLRMLDVPDNAIALEISEMATFQFAATASKAVLGSMNDFNFNVKFQALQTPNPMD